MDSNSGGVNIGCISEPLSSGFNKAGRGRDKQSGRNRLSCIRAKYRFESFDDIFLRVTLPAGMRPTVFIFDPRIVFRYVHRYVRVPISRPLLLLLFSNIWRAGIKSGPKNGTYSSSRMMERGGGRGEYRHLGSDKKRGVLHYRSLVKSDSG